MDKSIYKSDEVNLKLIILLILMVILLSSIVSSESDPSPSSESNIYQSDEQQHQFTQQQFYTPTPILKEKLKSDVEKMFYHGYDNYMKYSFPMDELKPISCTGSNTFGDYALTFIDSLDTLVVMGNLEEFERGIKWVSENIRFDNDITVSVFETNIRVLGGLLSSHILAEDHITGYDGSLLPLAIDLGDRLLRAFDTPTGIPYGAVNLKYGVPIGEITITSTASATTFSLEFGILSRLSGDSKYDDAARRAVRSIWKYRSELELVGNHINIINGEWTIKEAGIGTGVDSFFEYLYKAAIYFDDAEYLDLFQKNYQLINKYIKKDPWYVDVSIDRASIVWPIYNSLQSFWPGIQSMYGDYENAFSTIKSFHIVWRRYGFIPEGYNLLSGNVQPNQKGYPLRPELAESLYHMYQTNKDPIFIRMAKDLVWTINNITTTKCGHANVLDVELHTLDDRMESFFLSETCKYLYLLFNSADNYNGTNNHPELENKNSNPINMESSIFNTEGHIFPMQYRFFKKFNNNQQTIDNYQKQQQSIFLPITPIKKQKSSTTTSTAAAATTPQQTSSPKKKKDKVETFENPDEIDVKDSKDSNNEVIEDVKVTTVEIEEKKQPLVLDINKNILLERANWTCDPLPFLRRISSGTFQFIGGPQDIDWFEDKKIKEAMHDLST